ncbi:MAG: peptidoglycan-binding domain-containing protein, partial [Bacteroidota bacterium]
MDYPKKVIEKGETNKTIVKAVQTALNNKGCGPVLVDGDFGNETQRAVKLFQTRNMDANGNPLTIDGKIGAITWAILFGQNTVPLIEDTSAALLSKALHIAISQIGVIEKPAYSNRGKEIDEYLRTVGL